MIVYMVLFTLGMYIIFNNCFNYVKIQTYIY